MNRHDYAAKMELKKQNNIAAGLVSERFPAVTGMVIHMTYYRKAAIPLLMVRTLNIFPTSFAYFKMECMIKGCSGGGFDLTPVVLGMIKAKKKEGKGTITCSGKVDLLEPGHASMQYEAEIRYKKAPKSNS